MASDATLAGWLAEYKGHRAAEADAAAAAKRTAAKVAAELERRGAKTLEVRGFKVQRKVNRIRHYDMVKMKQRLGRKAFFPSIIKTTLDSDAVKAELKSGRLKQTDLDDCLIEITESEPYVVVDVLA